MTSIGRRLRPTRTRHGHEQQRPDDVELLLHRERPGVLQQRRVAHHVEVRAVRDDLVPVREVEERAEHVAAGVAEVLAREDRREDERPEHDDDEGGQQPTRTSQPEAAQVDPVSRLPLDEQQRGDEVAAEDEEEVDTEEAARQPVDAASGRGRRPRPRARAGRPIPGGRRCAARWRLASASSGSSSLGSVFARRQGRGRRVPRGIRPARRARARDRSARRAKPLSAGCLLRRPPRRRAPPFLKSAARSRTRPTTLPVNEVASSRPSPVTTRSVAARRWSRSSRSATRSKPGRRRAPIAARPPASPPAAPEPGRSGTSSCASRSRRMRTCSGVAPFCGAKTSAASRKRASTSHATSSGTESGAAERLDGADSAVGRGDAAHADDDPVRADRDRGGDELAHATTRRAQRVVPLRHRRRA